jgi:DNA-binding CsgD family transcriptional regulator
MARKPAQRLLQETLQRINVLSFIGDANGRILWLNDAATDAFGDRAGDLYTAFVAPEDVRRVRGEIDQMRGGAVSRNFEIDVLLHDGHRRRVEISSAAIEGNAIFYGVFGIVQRPGSRLTTTAESPLTRRQKEVLELLAHGHSTKQIAATLHLSRETVRNHVRGVLRALGAHSRIEAVAEARHRGLI